MKSLVYLVNCESYDSDAGRRYTNIVEAFYDLQKANECKIYLEQRYARLKELTDKVRAFSTRYGEENSFEGSGVPSSIDKPRWPAGLGKDQITDSMRAERKRIEELNAARHKIWSEKYGAWRKKYEEAVLNYAISLTDDLDEQNAIIHPYYNLETDAKYMVGEMEVTH